MHDIKFIKDNSSLFDEILKKRNISSSSEAILQLHQDYLENLKKNTKFAGKEKFFFKKILSKT